MTNRPAPARAGAALALCCAALAAQAQVIGIAWDDGGRFDRSTDVAAGKFVEVCGKLSKGLAIAWSFNADQALDFNIHFHAGKQVHYPAQQAGVANATGTLAVSTDQDYCWMWSNKTAAPVALRFVLKR